jgi:hypothetical protein
MEKTLFNSAKDRFDLFAFLDEYKIDYAMEGKNIGVGYVGIYECPHCGIGNYHYGINIEEKFGTCWSCGFSDNLVNIIRLLTEVTYYEAKEYLISSVYTEEDIEVQVHGIFNDKKKTKEEKKEKEIVLPKSVDLYKYMEKNKTIKSFCKEKNITYKLAQWLDLKIGSGSKFKNNLIIPVYYYGDLIGYQVRSFINRYFHNEGSLKHYLYNYDNIKKHSKIVIVEGFSDWTATYKFLSIYRKKTNMAVTTPFSKILTEEQIELLEDKEPEMVIFMLDYDAWFQYYKPSFKFFCDTDFIIPPRNTDPGQLTNGQFLKTFIEHSL